MSFTSFTPCVKSVHNIKRSGGGRFLFEGHREGDSAGVGHEDLEGSSIAEVSVRASSPVFCTGVVITSLTSEDDCGTDFCSSIVRDTSPREARFL